MIITHLNAYHIGLIGGLEVYLSTLLQTQKQYGVDSYCFVGSHFKQGDPVFQEYHSYLDLSKDDNDIEGFVQKCKEAFDRSSAVHFHDLHIFAGPGKTNLLHHILTCTYPKLRLFLNVHTLREEESSWDIIRRFGEGNIICYSDFIARSIKEHTSITPYVLPLCFPFQSERKDQGTVDGMLDVLQPTRFSWEKGPHLSLAAVVQLFDEGYDNFKFTQAGVTEKALPYVWQEDWDTRFPNLRDKVNFYLSQGRLAFQEYSYQEMVDRIACADIILHPTIGEGVLGEPFSISAAQSIIAKRAIIVSDSGFLPELVAPSAYNLAQVIPMNDHLALKQALRKWLDTPIPTLTKESSQYTEMRRQRTEEAVLSHINFYKQYLN